MTIHSHCESFEGLYSDVGEGGVAVNCEKTQLFLSTMYLIKRSKSEKGLANISYHTYGWKDGRTNKALYLYFPSEYNYIFFSSYNCFIMNLYILHWQINNFIQRFAAAGERWIATCTLASWLFCHCNFFSFYVYASHLYSCNATPSLTPFFLFKLTVEFCRAFPKNGYAYKQGFGSGSGVFSLDPGSSPVSAPGSRSKKKSAERAIKVIYQKKTLKI